MAVVIHTIKGHQYAYNHHREGNKVICDYLYPVDHTGKTRPTQQVTQHTNEGKPDYTYTPYEQKSVFMDRGTPKEEFHHLLHEMRKKDGNFKRVEKFEDMHDTEKHRALTSIPRKEYQNMSLDNRAALSNNWYNIMNRSIIKILKK
jgi:hypothetical protein